MRPIHGNRFERKKIIVYLIYPLHLGTRRFKYTRRPERAKSDPESDSQPLAEILARSNPAILAKKVVCSSACRRCQYVVNIIS